MVLFKEYFITNNKQLNVSLLVVDFGNFIRTKYVDLGILR
jgi:hypothetical protein